MRLIRASQAEKLGDSGDDFHLTNMRTLATTEIDELRKAIQEILQWQQEMILLLRDVLDAVGETVVTKPDGSESAMRAVD